jgi:hypothetical protein
VGFPQRSRNELLRLAGEEFGFETYEVEGVRYMLARELSYRLYRTTNISALRKLLLRWRRPLMSIRCVGLDGQHTFKRLFKLANRANWTLFATWDHFAIAAMKSKTKMGFQEQSPENLRSARSPRNSW